MIVKSVSGQSRTRGGADDYDSSGLIGDNAGLNAEPGRAGVPFSGETKSASRRLIQILRISHHIPEPNSQSQPAIEITTATKKAALYGSCLTRFTRLLRSDFSSVSGPL